MSEEAKQRQAEELLERALSAFGECEPPVGLEERILEQVRGAQSKRSFFWLAALAAAASLLIGLILIDDWRAVQPPETTVAEKPATPIRPEPEPPRQLAQSKPQAPRPPAPPRRSTVREAPAVEVPTPAEESAISALPQSELAFSEISSSAIEIQELNQGTLPLVSELNGSDRPDAPASEALVSGL